MTTKTMVNLILATTKAMAFDSAVFLLPDKGRGERGRGREEMEHQDPLSDIVVSSRSHRPLP
jgi:hypothetical protein